MGGGRRVQPRPLQQSGCGRGQADVVAVNPRPILASAAIGGALSRVGPSIQRGMPLHRQVLVGCRSYSGMGSYPDIAAIRVVSDVHRRTQGSQQKLEMRSVRFQNALFLHRTGKTGLRTSRLRMPKMP
jgi:hypothetical protein